MSFINNGFPYKSILLVIFSCSLLLAGGCSGLGELVRNIQKPQLSVTDVRVTDFDFRDIELTFDITVDNPNAFSVQMLSYGYNLDINERSFVSGDQQDETRIEASGASTFQVPVRLNFQDVYSTAGELADSDEAAYDFTSTFTFDLRGLGRTDVPLRKQGNIPLLRLPSVRIGNLQLNDLNMNRARLTLNMEFDNPNGIGLNINAFDYNLNINGSRWAGGTALEGVSIPEDNVAELQIPVELNIAEMGLGVYRLLTGSENLEYEIDGNFSVEVPHPLLGETDLNISRSGQVPLAGEN